MSNTSDLTRSAKAHLDDLGAKAKETATQEAAAQADAAKNATADTLQQAANVADAAAAEMDPTSPQAQAVHQVASQIEDVAAKLRNADIQKLAGQASDMVRGNPLLFVGGAAIAGFAAARFLKARTPQQEAPQHSSRRESTHDIADDPWASPRPYDPAHETVLSKINGEASDA